LTALLGREAILGALDIKTEDVAVPEWGGTVRVKGLTAGERDAFESTILVMRGKRRELNMLDMRARLVSLSLVDEAGSRLFTKNDVAALAEKSASALDRVFEVAQRLSGITDGDMEDLEGNSEPGQSDASRSA
jgi:hypothetical protein